MLTSKLAVTERVQNQSLDEWRDEYEGTSVINEQVHPQVTTSKSDSVKEIQSIFLSSLKEAGIVSVRFLGKKLLITTDRYITDELNKRIRKNIFRLVKIAEPDSGESLYEYTGYRTLFSQNRPYVAVEFKEVYTGAIADRYFNIKLKNQQGKSFKTGSNGEFRVVGRITRLQQNMFLYLWMDAVKTIPDDRISHIYRYMRSKLSGVVVSCSDTLPHHGATKLKTLKYEGHLYDIK